MEFLGGASDCKLAVENDFSHVMRIINLINLAATDRFDAQDEHIRR